jgi:hypothetical protein
VQLDVQLGALVVLFEAKEQQADCMLVRSAHGLGLFCCGGFGSLFHGTYGLARSHAAAKHCLLLSSVVRCNGVPASARQVAVFSQCGMGLYVDTHAQDWVWRSVVVLSLTFS